MSTESRLFETAGFLYEIDEAERLVLLAAAHPRKEAYD